MHQVRVRFTVEPNYAGWRLDRYLQEKIRRLSRERVQFLIAHRLEQMQGGAPIVPMGTRGRVRRTPRTPQRATHPPDGDPARQSA